MARKNKGPYLATNPAGVWEIRWTEAGRSRRKSTGTDDHAAAAAALAAFLKDNPVVTDMRLDMTIADVLDLYWTWHVVPHVGDQARIAIIHRWLAAGLGPVRCRELNDTHVSRYIDARQAGRIGQPVKIGTIWRELAGLRSAIHYAIRQRFLPGDSKPRFTMPAPPARRERWLTEKQVSELLQSVAYLERGRRAGRAYRFTVLALATGARKRAIELLRWSQVDLDHKLVRYDLQVDKQTRKRRAAAPLADWSVPLLTAFHEQRSDSDFVLDDDTDIRHAFAALMHRVAKHTGDDSYHDVTPHVLRHTTATLMLRAGASLWQVAGLLGDTPETVARVYGHHAHDHVREGANLWRPV